MQIVIVIEANTLMAISMADMVHDNICLLR